MSLADALKEHAPTVKGPTCTVCKLMDNLDPADVATLKEALASPLYTHAGISRALKAEGHLIGAETVSRHRKGDCLGTR